MQFNLKVLCEEDSGEWDRIIEESSHGTVFHMWDWLRLMEKNSWITVLGKKISPRLYPLAGYKGDKLIGVFPVYHTKTGLINLVSSPPSRVGAYYLGPVIADYANLKQDKRELNYFEFIRSVDEFIFKKLGAKYATLSTPPGLSDIRPLSWMGYQVKPMYNYVLDLTRGVEALWDDFKKDLRRDIKKAEKHELSVVEGGEEELKFIYRSYFARIAEQNITFRMGEDFLVKAFKRFHPKNLRVFLLRDKSEPVGGLIALSLGDKFSPWIGSHKSDKSVSTSNDFLHWELIKWASENGFKSFEMTWANNPRLCRFKSKYNPGLDPYFLASKYSSALYWIVAESYMRLKNPRHGMIVE